MTTTRVILMNDEDARIEREYQATRSLAHRLADKTKDNHCVIEAQNAEEDYLAVPETKVPKGRKVWYTARPGTVTYMQYKSEVAGAGIAFMGHSEWANFGRLSYSDEILKRYGSERGGEMLAKSKHKGPKRTKTIAVAGVGEPSVDMPTRGKTRQVWAIADSLVVNGVSAARAAIIEACLAAGVNKGTASTQYSAWVRARREVK